MLGEGKERWLEGLSCEGLTWRVLAYCQEKSFPFSPFQAIVREIPCYCDCSDQPFNVLGFTMVILAVVASIIFLLLTGCVYKQRHNCLSSYPDDPEGAKRACYTTVVKEEDSKD